MNKRIISVGLACLTAAALIGTGTLVSANEVNNSPAQAVIETESSSKRYQDFVYTIRTDSSEKYVYDSDSWSGSSQTVYTKSVVILAYTGSEKELTIPEKIDDVDVVYIESNAFEECSSIESVTFPSTLKTIGSSAFKNCTSLKKVVIPNNVESIGSYAFSGCASLEDITLPNYEGRSGNYGSYVFQNCTSLKSVVFPAVMTSSYSSYSSNGSYMFAGCTALESASITAPENNNDNSTSSYSRTYCTVPNGMFKDCASLKNITLPNAVTNLGSESFGGCTSLEEFVIPDSVTSITTNCFNGCASLKKIHIPKNMTSFSNGSSSYTTTSYSSTTSSYYEFTYSGSGPFTGCSALEAITVDSENTKFTSVDGVLYSKDMTVLFRMPQNKNITDFTVPDSVNIIGNDSFSFCNNLKNVNVGENVYRIQSYAFACCPSLYSVKLSEGLLYIEDYAFAGSRALASLSVPSTVKSVSDGLCNGCYNLTKLSLRNSIHSFENSNRTSSFYYDKSSSDYYETSSKASYDYAASSVSSKKVSRCFRGCDNLTIYCNNDSKAYEYAEECGIPTKSLSAYAGDPLPSPRKSIVGDVDYDEEITANDALLVLRNSVKLESFDSATKKVADVDGDNSITSSDSLFILRHSVGYNDNGILINQ